MMAKIRTIKTLGGLTLFAGIFLASGVIAGSIENSKHDFSKLGWNDELQICVFCHTPHHAKMEVADAPLWNHEVTTKSYDTYYSPTLTADIGQPFGISKLCLSCHDGTVAIDAYGDSTTGDHYVSGVFLIGGEPYDLADDHPISIKYDQQLAIDDGGLHNPTDTTIEVEIGSGDKTKTGTIDEVLLYDTYLQCASCHDVHNNFVYTDTTDSKLLKITLENSKLCLTCHNK